MSLDNSTLPTIQLNTGALAYLQRIARTEGDTMSQVSLASLSFGEQLCLLSGSPHLQDNRDIDHSCRHFYILPHVRNDVFFGDSVYANIS